VHVPHLVSSLRVHKTDFSCHFRVLPILKRFNGRQIELETIRLGSVRTQVPRRVASSETRRGVTHVLPILPVLVRRQKETPNPIGHRTFFCSTCRRHFNDRTGNTLQRPTVRQTLCSWQCSGNGGSKFVTRPFGSGSFTSLRWSARNFARSVVARPGVPDTWTRRT
jgi:hypothetical protein